MLTWVSSLHYPYLEIIVLPEVSGEARYVSSKSQHLKSDVNTYNADEH